MHPERRRKVRIAILASPIVMAIVAGYLLSRPPFAFASGAKPWFAQLNPSDPNEIWLFYAHPEPPYGIIDDARKELALEPAHEFRILVPKGTRGSKPFDPMIYDEPVAINRSVDDSNVATNRASFLVGNTQVLIEVGHTKFDGSEMMGQTGPWPKDHTLIAIRRPTNALDIVRAWIVGIQWRGLPASAETELFKGIENDRHSEDQMIREARRADLEAEERAKATRTDASRGQAKLP